MHAMKYHATELDHMFAHWDREPEAMRRRNIDPAKTATNYAIGPQRDRSDVMTARAVIDAQPGRKRKTRKDAVLVVDWIITAPDDLRPGDERRFFEAAHAELARRYGEDNMLGGRVHLDEPGARPHMHDPFMPIVRDKKTGMMKFDAKHVLDQRELKSIHKEMNDAIDRAMGYHVSIILDETERDKKKLSRLSHADYAATTAAIARQAGRAEAAKAEAEKAKGELEQIKADVYALGPAGGGIDHWHADGTTEHEASLKEVRAQRDAEAARMREAWAEYDADYQIARERLGRLNDEINDKAGELGGLEGQLARAQEAMPSADEVRTAQEAVKTAETRARDAEAAEARARRNKAALEADIANNLTPAAERAKAEAGVTTAGLEGLWARLASWVAGVVVGMWDRARDAARAVWKSWADETPRYAPRAGLSAERAQEINIQELAASCDAYGRGDVYRSLTAAGRAREGWER